MRKWFAAVLLILGATTVPMTTTQLAGAQAPDAQGWWYLYKTVPLPVDPKPLVPQLPDLPELPNPPTVPADGLYVAGGAQGPEAVSAVTWVIPEGASAESITMVAAVPLAPNATIRLCTVNATYRPVQGGSWASKPPWSCAGDAPVGVIPTDGASITWKLGALGQSRLIDVALVPTEGAVFQANFNKPDKNSLKVIPGAAADTASAGGTGAGVLGSTTEPNSLNSALDNPSFTPTLAPYLQPGTDTNVGAAPIVDYSQQPSALAQQPQTVVSTKDNLETFGIFGLIALAALFSRFRSQPSREPRSLVNFGKTKEVEVS